MLSFEACPAVQYLSILSYKRHDFRQKMFSNIKRVFWFSLQLLSETFLTTRRTERDNNVSAICGILRKPEFSRQILGKSWNNKFHANRSSGSRTVRSERSDGDDEAKSCFLQFCERAHKVQWKQLNPVHRQLYVCTHVTTNRCTTWRSCYFF
jgi:hypothetical protein